MTAGTARTFATASNRSSPLALGQSIIEQEAAALSHLAATLDETFCTAVEMIGDCPGCLIVTGIGKAGWIGQKIAATLASTGTPSHFLHPAEAIHGDLGRIRQEDTILILSFSGETDEITRLLPSLAKLECPLIAITSRATNSLGQAADCVLALGSLREAGPLELAPSTSTTAMLALGDALALAVAKQREFRAHDFARFHPGGSLGRKLARVEDAMRPLSRCRIAHETHTVREVLIDVGQPGRRTGAIMLVNATGHLTGIFTDSDLARLFESRREALLDDAISHVMCNCPTTMTVGSMLSAAVEIMATRKISELPVIDDEGRPAGMIDITDVVTSDSPLDPSAAAPLKLVPFPRVAPS